MSIVDRTKFREYDAKKKKKYSFKISHKRIQNEPLKIQCQSNEHSTEFLIIFAYYLYYSIVLSCDINQ